MYYNYFVLKIPLNGKETLLCRDATISLLNEISDIIKKLDIDSAIYRIRSLDYDDYDDYDQDEYFDKIYKILLPLNEQVKKVFILCNRIEDKVLRDQVCKWMADFFQVDVRDWRNWDSAIQLFIEYNGGLDDIDDMNEPLKECMEATFDEYLKTHDESLF